jgi:hypothetical protein
LDRGTTAHMTTTSLVRQQSRRFFGASQADDVIAAFDATELPLIANNGERVFLAILLLSRGDMQRFRMELQQARIDWRDTLVAAGLANEDWPSVLRQEGIEISG